MNEKVIETMKSKGKILFGSICIDDVYFTLEKVRYVVEYIKGDVEVTDINIKFHTPENVKSTHDLTGWEMFEVSDKYVTFYMLDGIEAQVNITPEQKQQIENWKKERLRNG